MAAEKTASPQRFGTSHLLRFPVKLGLIGLIVFLSVVLKVALLSSDSVPFNADESIVALMARHILQGERPIFFYGQAYMGSLDAWLVALGFALFGEKVWVIRLVQICLYAATVLSTMGLGWLIWRDERVGLLAGLFLAVPNVNVTLYTTVSLGGYGEAMLIGNLILMTTLILNHYLLKSEDKPSKRIAGLWFLLGFWVGLGLWVHGLTLVYAIPALLFLLFWGRGALKPRPIVPVAALFIGGFFLGSSPWWYFALTRGWQPLLAELLGSAVAVETGGVLQRWFQHGFAFLVLGLPVILGFRPPWAVEWLGLPLMPFVLVLWLLIAAELLRRLRNRDGDVGGEGLLLGVCLTLVAGFVFTSFGIDPSGRYFLPLAVPLTLWAARWVLSLPKVGWQVALSALLVGYHLIGIVTCALNNPPGITTQFYEPARLDQRYLDDLAAFLQTHGEVRGYSTYWIAYPLAFISQEQIIFSPRLPYHPDLRYTSRDDRYPAYTEQVKESPRVAYITARNPTLDNYLKVAFARLGVQYHEQVIGDYHVFYHLSRPVHPWMIGLGYDRP